MQKINILKRLDQYLLKNHPIIWRTRIHYFVIFSALIGNVLAFAVPFLYPLTTSQLPTGNYLESFQLISIFFGGFAFLYWGYKLTRYRLKSASLKASLSTMFLYWLGCLCIVSNLWIFNKTVEYKIGNLIEEEELHEDYIKIDGYVQGTYELDKSEISALVEKYGVDSDLAVETYRPSKQIGIPPETEYFYEGTSVRFRINFILSCKQYCNQLNTRNGFQTLFIFTFIGLLALPMTAMLISLSSFIPIIGFLFAHFLYMVLLFNIGFYDSHFEEAYLVLFGIGLLGVFLAFRRIPIKKLLQLFLMTVSPPMIFFYLVNNVNHFRNYSEVVPMLIIIAHSLLITILTGLLAYWYQQSSLKPHP